MNRLVQLFRDINSLHIIMKKPKFLYVGAGFIAVVIFAGIIVKASTADRMDDTNQPTSATTSVYIPTEIIGDQLNEERSVDQIGMSWPGEIFSSGDVDVQPQREGTIVEWKVKIGQYVKQGQMLARLSAPPATSELTAMLAEQVQSFTKAKAVAEAETIFVKKNKEQLMVLRNQIVNSGKQISDSLSDDVNSDRSQSITTLQASLDASKRDLEVKTQSVKDYSSQTVRKVFPLFTNYSADPFIGYKEYLQNFSVRVRYGLGEQKDSAQIDFIRDSLEAIKAVVHNEPSIGEKTLKFLQSADSLVANSFRIDGSIDGLVVLRDAVSEERMILSEKLIEHTEAKTETSKMESELASKKIELSLAAIMSNKETSEKLKEIDERLIDLDRQLKIVQAEADAARAAYNTIANALTGGTGIVAPRAGIVSIINNKVGDFVGPGTSVASMNSGNVKDRIVRFKIPGNVIPPKAGDVLTVIRPGFPGDVKKIKLAGIGLSLDGVGSFVADADFMESVDWPTHASVRVISSLEDRDQMFASLSALWWDASGKSFVWLVTEENRIRPQEVKTGRAIGDKIEISEGLVQGNKIVLKATSDLKTGMQLSQIQKNDDQKNQEPSATEDTHGHGE